MVLNGKEILLMVLWMEKEFFILVLLISYLKGKKVIMGILLFIKRESILKIVKIIFKFFFNFSSISKNLEEPFTVTAK